MKIAESKSTVFKTLSTLAGLGFVGLSSYKVISGASWEFPGCSMTHGSLALEDQNTINYCPLFPKLVPSEEGSQFVNLSYFSTEEYKAHSLQVWRDAVRIYSPSFDDLGPVGEDPRWEVFYEFAAYLKKAFPLTHEKFNLTKVNTHGLVYYLKGSNEDLRPILLASHQDVVPIPEETVPRWTYPPFEGHFDGEFLWGRGSSDCKNNLIGIMEATELLLSKGFEPKRGIVLAFGFDEESSGEEGAKHIAQHLLSEFGEKSIFAIIDEGGLGIQDLYGTRFAMPSTGEKGYVDVDIEVKTVGGHSSVPPKHTGIGIISHLIYLLESEDYPLDISSKNPYFYQLQCTAQYAAKIDDDLRFDIKHILTDDESKAAVLEELGKDPITKVLVSTSRAIDIINGGLKINALPETVKVSINHRVGYDSSIEEVKKTIEGYALQIAEIYGMSVDSFDGNTIDKYSTSGGEIILQSKQEKLQAPQTSIINNPTWEILAGTIKHIFEDFAKYPNAQKDVSGEVIVSPSVMTGNTDTLRYWDLADNIYRFTPIRQDARFNAHAIDERVELDAHVEGVAFYYEFIRNADESTEI